MLLLVFISSICTHTYYRPLSSYLYSYQVLVPTHITGTCASTCIHIKYLYPHILQALVLLLVFISSICTHTYYRPLSSYLYSYQVLVPTHITGTCASTCIHIKYLYPHILQALVLLLVFISSICTHTYYRHLCSYLYSYQVFVPTHMTGTCAPTCIHIKYLYPHILQARVLLLVFISSTCTHTYYRHLCSYLYSYQVFVPTHMTGTCAPTCIHTSTCTHTYDRHVCSYLYSYQVFVPTHITGTCAPTCIHLSGNHHLNHDQQNKLPSLFCSQHCVFKWHLLVIRRASAKLEDSFVAANFVRARAQLSKLERQRVLPPNCGKIMKKQQLTAHLSQLFKKSTKPQLCTTLSISITHGRKYNSGPIL